MRLSRPWVTLEEIEIKPLPVAEKSPASRRLIQDEEARRLLSEITNKLPEKAPFFLIDERGRALNSRQWSELMDDWERSGLKAVGLCLGSSLGFSASLKEKAKAVLSLGPQTMPHELARVVLMEQIYRAAAILKGHPYHNEG